LLLLPIFLSPLLSVTPGAVRLSPPPSVINSSTTSLRNSWASDPCLIQTCPNGHEDDLVKSVEHVHQLMWLYRREGDGHVIGFYPRKGKITVYLMDGTARYSELLAKLGKHTTTGYCVYIKRLSDVELPILEQIVQQSYEYIKSKSQDGPIDRILWQTEK